MRDGQDGQHLERLKAALEALEGLDERPLCDEDLRTNQHVRDLFASIDSLVASGSFDSVFETLEPYLSEARDFSDAREPLQSLLAFAFHRENDRVFFDHGVEGLSVFRAEFVGHELELGGRDARVLPAASALVPQTTRQGERTLLTLLAGIQVMVDAIPHERIMGADTSEVIGSDAFGLMGTVAASYLQGRRRRAAWGSGSCVLTDQRMIGLLFTDEIQGHPGSGEAAAMPRATATSEVSSVVMFEAQRELFMKREVSTGSGPMGKFFHNRLPTVSLLGSGVDVVIDVVRMVAPDGQIVRPGRGVVDAAALQFCDGSVS